MWVSHFFPRLFRVTATAAWAVPPYADLPLLNPPGELTGRIAVVMRGVAPISAKALFYIMAPLNLQTSYIRTFRQHFAYYIMCEMLSA